MFITYDVSQFKARISQLNIQNIGDGSVSVVNGILHAARASQPDSTILASKGFSRSTEDMQLLGRAEAMISEKNLKLLFIQTQNNAQSLKSSAHMKQKGKRRQKRLSNDDVYEELEMFSDGQIIEIPSSNISELASFVTFSVLSSNTILRVDTMSDRAGDHDYSFPVDSYTSQILIFVNGENINVTVLTPQGIVHIRAYIM